MTEPSTPPQPPTASWPRWIVTFGGAGMLPGAPGTWGSLATALLLWLAYRALGRPSFLVWHGVLAAGLVLSSAATVLLGRWTVSYYRREDPGCCVIDEVAGICLTLCFQPMLSAAREGWVVLAAFAAFRIFDVWKPPPVRQAERLPLGWGILADDLVAAVYANVLCQLVLRLVLVSPA